MPLGHQTVAGGMIAVKNAVMGHARFVRWYVDVVQGLDPAHVVADGNTVSGQLAAARLVNALVLAAFSRAAIPGESRRSLHEYLGAPFMEAVISKGELMAYPGAVIDGLVASLEAFQFSVDDVDVVSGADLVSPAALDEACEALVRSMAGREKIASRGTFYTDRSEISFMCKLLVSRLIIAKVPGVPIESIRRLVLDTDNALPSGTTVALFAPDVAARIINCLLVIRVLDPACGSGAFLVEMANTCSEIIARLLVRDDTKVITRVILGQTLLKNMHGIDNDGFALQAARVRLYAWYLKMAYDCNAPLESITLPPLAATIVESDFFWFHPPSEASLFDAIIGNPPYVRQEDIKPGRCGSPPSTRDEKARYKTALIAEVNRGVPVIPRLSRSCDLYVYFFVKAIQVLRGGGELCFITSNSWLDARFGRDMQVFLLLNTTDLSIYDSSEKSFGRAEINTVITACTRLGADAQPGSHVAFVHLKAPLDQVTRVPSCFPIPVTACGVRSQDQAMSSEAFPGGSLVDSAGARLVLVPRETLLPISKSSEKTAGGSWRANYLNKHDVYYSVIRKAAGRLVPLGSIASVKAGCYSGINDFFYVTRKTAERFGIEAQFVRPLLRSAKEVKTLAMAVPEGHLLVSIPATSKAELDRLGCKGIASYITWGESQCTRRGQKTARGIPWPRVESVRHRDYWYSLPPGNIRPARLLMQYIAHDRFYCPWSAEGLVPDRCFHRIEMHEGIDIEVMAALLNSTFQSFIVMVTGRVGLGGGALKLEALDVKSLPVLDPRSLRREDAIALSVAIEALGRRKPLSIFEECGIDARSTPHVSPMPLPDRLALDKIVFDVLGLDDEEREALYIAACSVVSYRLKKAKSRE